MGQQHGKPSEKDKLRRYLTNLCGPEPSEPEVIQPERQNYTKRSPDAPRRKRMTLMMDRVLLKLTRKNLNVKKCLDTHYVARQIQRHLASRLKGMEVVEFQGRFSESLINSVSQGIKREKPSRKTSSSSEGPADISQQSVVNVFTTVDCLVSARSSNPLKQISKTLRSNLSRVSNYIFVVQGELEAIEYHDLFMVYKEYYMFQVEKIMLMNECVSNVIYVTSCPDFLNIDSQTLSTFIVQEFTQVDNQTNQDRLKRIVRMLIELQLPVECCFVAGEILASDVTKDLEEQFLNKMNRKYPETSMAIGKPSYHEQSTENDQNSSSEVNLVDGTPSFNTPLKVACI